MKNLLRQGCALVVAAFALAAFAPCARAGAVYRCTTPDGQIAITNRPGDYAHCSKVPNSDYKDPPAAPKAAAKQGEGAGTVAVESINLKGSHSEYRSAAPVASAAGASTGDGAQKPSAPGNATEHPDAATQVRRGAVYKVAKANGIVEYTNVRPGGGAYQVLFTYIQTCYACDVHSTIDFATTALNLAAYKDEVAAAAAEFGVSAALVRAVMHAESAFRPNAMSRVGAQGLMQLMPATASDLGVGDPFEPAQNIRGGARYLAQLLRQFNNDERLATAAYNAGPQAVQKYGNDVPPYDETRVFVERVATLRKRYDEAR